MKTKKLVLGLLGIGIVFILFSCTGPIDSVNDSLEELNQTKSWGIAAMQHDSLDFSAILSENEITGLMEMREEEKLARDVYITFYDLYSQVIFSNIADSEESHTQAVLTLINGFGLIDPALENIGEFNNELFRDLYDQLIEKGSLGLVEALKIGAFIEEYDIADLEKFIAETENESIIKVFDNLLMGSKNHLKAFTNVLASLGEEYSPTIISQNAYEAILNDISNANNGFQQGNGRFD